MSRVYQAGTTGENNIPSSIGEIGKHERDGWGATLKLAISVLALVKRVLLSRDIRCLNTVGSFGTN